MKRNLDKLFDDYIQREYWGARDIASHDFEEQETVYDTLEDLQEELEEE